MRGRKLNCIAAGPLPGTAQLPTWPEIQRSSKTAREAIRASQARMDSKVKFTPREK